LSALSLPAVTRFSQSLDPRISRLCQRTDDAPAEGACARRRLRDAERDVIVDAIMRCAEGFIERVATVGLDFL
jgi:hypothetical protein